MNQLTKVAAITITAFSCFATAQSGIGSVHTDVGATLVSNNDAEELGYFIQIGYNYRVTDLLSADVTYKKVETLNSSVTATSNSFSRQYDAYGLGVRADYPLGMFNAYGKLGGSYIVSDTTTWSASEGAAITESDSTIKPYLSAGVSTLTQLGLIMDVGFTYQMLANGEQETSFVAGGRFSF